MIHEVGEDLGRMLKAVGVPMPVVDGPEPTGTATWSRERIVFGYNDESGDKFAIARSQSNSQKKQYATRSIGVKAIIYVQSPNPGALHFEHRRRADKVIDKVVVALIKIAALRKDGIAWTGGKYITPPDFKDTPQGGGVVYQLTLTFDRGIYDTKWNNDGKPTATLGKTATTDSITSANGPEGQVPEVACEDQAGG